MSESPALPVPDGVPEQAWLRLAKPDGGRWAIPERNAVGEVIGTAHRYPDGSKGFEKGGNRGLIMEWPLSAYAGTSAADPIFICEGASDTAALLGLGLCAVGVPMAGFGGAILAQVLKDRHAVTVSDADSSGRDGAGKIAAELMGSCSSVRLIKPPGDAKDARQAIIEGAGRSDFERLAREAFPWTGKDSFQSLRRNPVRIESEPYELVSIRDLGPAQEPDWLWEGYLARGAVTLLVGLWKAGKSTLVSHLLRDLYLGTGLVDERLDAPTLYISEESSSLWAARREALGLNESILFVKRPSFVRPNVRQWEDFLDAIATDVKRLGAGLIVFDTLAGAWCVQDENDASQTIRALMPLRQITDVGGAVLLVHHPRKGHGQEATATRGSGALTGFVDVILELRRHDASSESDRRRVLKAYGRFENTPPEQVVELTDEGYRMLGARAGVHEGDAMETIGTLLSPDPPGRTLDEIRSAWPTPSAPGGTRLRTLLNRGAEQRRWTRTGTGRKNDPHRFHRAAGAPDSIRSDPSLSDRIESAEDEAGQAA